MVPGERESADAARRTGVTQVAFDGSVIQRRFERVPTFRRASEAERDVFFEAAAAADPTRRRALVARGLDRARRQQARHYVEAARGLREVEELGLLMEGAAQFGAYRLASTTRSPAERSAGSRGWRCVADDDTWSGLNAAPWGTPAQGCAPL